MPDFRDLTYDALRQNLSRHVDGEVRFDIGARQIYSTDASIYRIEPAGVVIPRTPDALVAAVQIALEMGVPITARGAGTSLSGQSIGAGLIVDCSKYLNRIIDVDASARIARVQPGVVLDQLNHAVAGYGLQFGPDVATSNRANLGGMIGNNSAGARSIVYGKTIDHVRKVRVILADGSVAEFGPVGAAEWDRRAERNNLEGGIYRTVRHIVAENIDEIRKRYPKILRRVSGYNLDALVAGHLDVDPARRPGLKDLVVGSEGTLAILTEAELSLAPRPRSRGLLVPQFDSLTAALDALAACLEYRPSAVELMDQMLIDLAREQRSLREVMASITGRPAALLMVEFSGEDDAEVSSRVHDLQRRMSGVRGLMSATAALEPAQRDPLWNLRRAAMPLLYGMPGARKPVTFIEDTAVPPQRLPEYVARFREVLRKHGTDGAFYGHASVGCLHIRPLLNLKDPIEVRTMRQITEEVTDLVNEFGGALSGEHGDGLARSEWNRKMFGEQLYEAFRQVKRAFDPQNLFNPGKVVDAPAMTENLRYRPHDPKTPPTIFDYEKQRGFFPSIELCNGSGVCRKLQGGTMCPSFRATHDEKDNPRGRANALRLALVNEDENEMRNAESGVRNAKHNSPLRTLHSALGQRWVFDVMDLCLQCKACKTECPSNVDIAKLKSEFLHQYYEKKPRPAGHWLAANIHRLQPLAAPFAPLVNRLNRFGLFRTMIEKLTGVDRRRRLPEIRRDHFRRWFRRHRKEHRPARAGDARTVLLLDDCFTTFQEPRIAVAAVKVLERAGYRVELAGICCGRAMISKGFLPQARDLAAEGLKKLSEHIANGTPILGLEPSCILTLADEWPELVAGAHARKAASNAWIAEAWLEEQFRAGQCSLPMRHRNERLLFHAHCHQKALVGPRGTVSALRLLPGIDVQTLDAGCCGMAGSFGYEKDHFDLSVQIANLQLLPALAAEPNATVVATGTSCRHQIRDLAGRWAMHPMEVLAEAIS